MKDQLIEDCIAILKQGGDLLQTLETTDTYPVIGGHVRHCLDFVDCLIKGFETGRIDYNKRERDLRIEIDVKVALERLGEALKRLQSLSLEDFDDIVLVRHERANNSGVENAWCRSTLARELEFLQSHTVHHYAIIAIKLAALGISINETFGVADSTLKYRTQNI